VDAQVESQVKVQIPRERSHLKFQAAFHSWVGEITGQLPLPLPWRWWQPPPPLQTV